MRSRAVHPCRRGCVGVGAPSGTGDQHSTLASGPAYAGISSRVWSWLIATAPVAVLCGGSNITSGPVDPKQLNLPQSAELEAFPIPVTASADTTLPGEQT